MAALPFDRVLLDGEVVALDDQGLPSFQRLQSRARLRRPLDIRHAAVEVPVTYYAFDLLAFEDFADFAGPAASAVVRRLSSSAIVLPMPPSAGSARCRAPDT